MSRILLVDDEPRNLLALEALLGGSGRELVSVTSGEDALRIINERAVDLALLDVMMPRMDGLETAFALRGLSPELPIVFVTALDLDERLASAIVAITTHETFRKPVDAAALRGKVEEIEKGRTLVQRQKGS